MAEIVVDDSKLKLDAAVKLEAVKVETGEENEDVVFTMRSKVFVFIAEDVYGGEKRTNYWKERGTGDLRILVHKETKKSRLLMRQEKTMKVCANFAIPDVDLEENGGSDRSWLVNAADFAEGELEQRTFAFRFRDNVNATAFSDAYETARAANVAIANGEEPAEAKAAGDDEAAKALGALSLKEKDTHVSIVPIFTVPEGKMDDFKATFAAFYEGSKAGTEELLYYNFATCGDKAYCREGYKSAAGVLAHLGDVDAPLKAALAIVGEGGLDLSVMGPAAELEKLKEALTPLGCKFWATDDGSFLGKALPASGADTHVSIAPYFTVPEGKMDDFKAGFAAFYEGTKAGTDQGLYYGFATCGSKAYCREGYDSADGVLAHLADVKEPLAAALAIAGPGGLELNVMGPAAELEKLKMPLTPLGCKFWETDSGGFWGK